MTGQTSSADKWGASTTHHDTAAVVGRLAHQIDICLAELAVMVAKHSQSLSTQHAAHANFDAWPDQDLPCRSTT